MEARVSLTKRLLNPLGFGHLLLFQLLYQHISLQNFRRADDFVTGLRDSNHWQQGF